MDDSSLPLLLFLLLLVSQAALNMGYAALQNARQSELHEQAEQGIRNARRALRLLDAKSRLSATYMLTNSLHWFAMATLLAVQLIFPAIQGTSALGVLPAVGIAFLLALGIVILGMSVPEAIGSAYATPLIRLLGEPLRWLVGLLSPLTELMLGVSRLLAKVFGSEELVNTVTEEEIMTLVNAGHTGGTIEDEEKEMIYSVLQLDQTLAREVMIPRIDMVTVAVDTPLTDALDAFLRTGYSRIPAYEDNVDNIVGLLYAKDLLNLWNNGGLEGHTVRDLVRSAYFVPETLPADDLLRDLQTRNVHMAIVVDEYGGTSGLVTIENILEEIVGDIRDEFDLNEEGEYTQISEDEYIIDAGMDLDDLNEMLDTNLETQQSDTLGGFIYLSIGRVPIVGETIETDELLLRVRSLEGRRIRKVLLKRKPRLSDDEQDDVEPQQMADAS